MNAGCCFESVSYKMSLEGWRVSHRRMSLEEVKIRHAGG